MNQDHGERVVHRFPFSRAIRINVHVDRKIFFQQCIVFMFGADRLGEVIASLEPIILTLIIYETSFDVHVILL